MPRKFLKRYSPSQKTIRSNRALAYLGEGIYQPHLWHMNRNSVARAFAIGLFCTWIPIPLQTILAALLALYYRAHLPLSVALVFVSNPVTIPPMFYFAYKLGSVMLGLEIQSMPMNMSWDWFSTTAGQIWQPIIFGSLTLAIVSSATAYFTINTLWRKSIKARWKHRQKMREEEQAKEAVLQEIKKAMKDG